MSGEHEDKERRRGNERPRSPDQFPTSQQRAATFVRTSVGGSGRAAPRFRRVSSVLGP